MSNEYTHILIRQQKIFLPGSKPITYDSSFKLSSSFPTCGPILSPFLRSPFHSFVPRSSTTLRVQKYGNDGLKNGGKDVLWPMSLVTKGRFSLQPRPQFKLLWRGKYSPSRLLFIRQTKVNFRKTFHEF